MSTENENTHVQVWYLAYDEDGNGTGCTMHPNEHATYTDLVERVFNVIGYNEKQAQCQHVPSKTGVLQTVCSQCQLTIFNKPAGSDKWLPEDDALAAFDDDEREEMAEQILSVKDALAKRDYRSLWFAVDELLKDNNRTTYTVGLQWLPVAELTAGPLAISRQFGSGSAVYMTELVESK